MCDEKHGDDAVYQHKLKEEQARKDEDRFSFLRHKLLSDFSLAELVFANVSTNQQELPLLTGYINSGAANVVGIKESSAGIQLPSITSTCKVNKAEASSISEELVAPSVRQNKCITTEKRPISYNIRRVLQKKDHPLWSSSLSVRLRHLFGNSVPAGFCGFRENRQMETNSLELGKMKFSLSPLIAARPYKHAGELNGYNAEKLMSGPFASSFSPPLNTEARSCRGINTNTEEGSFSVSSAVKGETKLQRFRLREFATCFAVLLSEECVGREIIIKEECYDALRTLPLPPHMKPGTPHPSLAGGLRDISLTEEILRGYILEEERKEFSPILDFFIFENRCVRLGTAPLCNFLRRWLWLHRGRKIRRQARLKQILQREENSRMEVLIEWEEEQQSLFSKLIVANETLFRIKIERLQLCTNYSHGVVFISLQERVELFPLLYGKAMSGSVACGRVSGVTLFKQLDLLDTHYRRNVEHVEHKERIVIFCTMLMDKLTSFCEGHQRQWIEDEEFFARMKLFSLVCAMCESRHRREIEILEACEREIDIARKLRAKVMLIERQINKEKEEI